MELSRIRRIIADSMFHSISSTAQLTINASFDASRILELRKRFREKQAIAGENPAAFSNITVTDMILYAVSRVILNHRELNAHFIQDKMLLFNNVHLGFAVDTERGLMVPTIFNANRKTLQEISEEASLLAQQCKKGTINPDLLKGATFTVTNLGPLGIESFTPILNPPQTGILGVNTIIHRFKEKDGCHVLYPSIGLSLTFDHRAVDGAPAARFLRDLGAALENFSTCDAPGSNSERKEN